MGYGNDELSVLTCQINLTLTENSISFKVWVLSNRKQVSCRRGVEQREKPPRRKKDNWCTSTMYCCDSIPCYWGNVEKEQDSLVWEWIKKTATIYTFWILRRGNFLPYFSQTNWHLRSFKAIWHDIDISHKNNLFCPVSFLLFFNCIKKMLDSYRLINTKVCVVAVICITAKQTTFWGSI